MKFFSISTIRSPASVLVLASTIMFSVSGIAQAQTSGDMPGQGTAAGQGSATGQKPASGGTATEVDPGLQGTNIRERNTEGSVDGYGILEEGVDTGFVDQEKRVERNQDPRSPSPDDHVDIRYEKEIKDPAREQGGPIGPN